MPTVRVAGRGRPCVAACPAARADAAPTRGQRTFGVHLRDGQQAASRTVWRHILPAWSAQVQEGGVGRGIVLEGLEVLGGIARGGYDEAGCAGRGGDVGRLEGGDGSGAGAVFAAGALRGRGRGRDLQRVGGGHVGVCERLEAASESGLAAESTKFMQLEEVRWAAHEAALLATGRVRGGGRDAGGIGQLAGQSGRR